MTPEENRRRLAHMRFAPTVWCEPTHEGQGRHLSALDMLYAAKIGGAKNSGRQGPSHASGSAKRPGVKQSIKVQKLG